MAAKIEPLLFNKEHVICLTPDIYRPLADIVCGLLAEKGALVGFLARKKKPEERRIGKAIVQGRPVQT